MSEELLRVSSVSVRGLFGIYQHEVGLNAENRVTIIHGPNGVGKTVLLKCIAAFFRGHYSLLRATPFESFSVVLSNGTSITLGREILDGEPPSRRAMARKVELTCEIRSEGLKQTFVVKESADIRRLASMIEQRSPYLRQVDDSVWIDRRTDRVLSAEEVVEENGHILGSGRLGRVREAESEVLQVLRHQVKCTLIETDRLVRYSGEDMEFRSSTPRRATVNEYAKDLQRQIEATLAQYGRKSQQLDQSFPQRLINEPVPTMALPELKRRMEALEERQRELSEIGLLDKVPTRPFDPDSLDEAGEAKLGPMILYLIDSEQKISAFDGIASRLKLLVDSAKTKFENKVISISKERGLQASSPGGANIPLDALSSGEQHELVLMYELLFKTSPNTLIMIDEPELSLHVRWQRMFLPELLAVAKTVGFDVLLATHSPFIVGSRHDLLVGLSMNQEDMPSARDLVAIPRSGGGE
jgi:ABC-type transport system involved in cytochrome c biogenesis ATPase subunit